MLPSTYDTWTCYNETMRAEGLRERPHAEDSRAEKQKEAKSLLPSVGTGITNPGSDMPPAFLLCRKRGAFIIKANFGLDPRLAIKSNLSSL